MTWQETQDISAYRPWAPGDGLNCKMINRATQGVPCGPPVISRDRTNAGRYGTSRDIEVICQHHVASRFIHGGIGKMNAELERDAREAVIAAHWDEYVAEKELRRAAMIAEALAMIPDELRPLIEAGLAAHAAAEAARP